MTFTKTKLKDLCIAKISNGAFNDPQKVGNGYRLINVKDLYTEPTINEESLCLLDLTEKEFKRYSVKTGDLFFTRSSLKAEGIAHCNIYTGVSENIVYECHIMRARLDQKAVIPLFLFHYCKSFQARKYFIQHSKVATMTTIDQSDLGKLPITLPPLPEQKAIADQLSTWDEAIEKTERLIQAKEKQLDAYARDLFDRKNDGKYEGWKVVKLKTVLNEHGDKSTGTEEVYSVSVRKGLVNQVEHLGRSFAAANTDNYNRVHHGDIVYTKSPTGDFPLGIVKQSYAKEDVIVSPLYGVFTLRTFNLGIVLDFYFSSPARARNYLFPIVQKGAKNTIAITNKTFLSKALHLPVDEKAQKAVAEFVYAARQEIDLLKQLADKYKTQKRGLMQRLLTGDWRIKPDVVKTFEEKDK